MNTYGRVRRFCRGLIRGSLILFPIVVGLSLGNLCTTREVIQDVGGLPEVYAQAEQKQTLVTFTEETKEEPDYLAEAKKNQVLYEELQIDPTSPRKLGEQELNNILRQLARKNEKFQVVYEKREELPWGLKASVCNYPEMIDFVLGFFAQDRKSVV